MDSKTVLKAFEAAVETYAAYGVDVNAALEKMKKIDVSVHCWQGDDVKGLEDSGGGTSGGILSTGSFGGKPRNGDELRADIDKTMSLLPGLKRLNLHACYAELNGEKVDRDQYETRHFQQWIDWAKSNDVALDFNATCFGHPMAADNLTLSNPDEKIRRFWINHVKAVRKIAADMGKALGKTVVNNIWVPDGMKDLTADRLRYRTLLRDSLDDILSVKYPTEYVVDAVESKVFGIGVESFTVGSHEFYMGYVAHQQLVGNMDLMQTLDMGHFHPTESIADKVSSLLLFNKKLLVHVSRPVRWDSDHVVISDESVQELMREIKRTDSFDRIFLATDFFDGSINRIAAWTVGLRATQKAILGALLEPTEHLKKAEAAGDFATRLALMEEFRNLPAMAVYNKYCLDQGVPVGSDYLTEIYEYSENVLAKR
ncbi:MAG: L-rhamnose isomerase [Eubacteriales bacterium]|nr:L-rhamnose isomerase [Eubacteriales bacterium]